MLLEEEPTVKEKAQVAPNRLGAKRGSPRERGIAKINRKGVKTPAS
jgi:hypothetical protein